MPTSRPSGFDGDAAYRVKGIGWMNDLMIGSPRRFSQCGSLHARRVGASRVLQRERHEVAERARSEERSS